MAQHVQHQHSGDGSAHDSDAHLAELLDLDAEALGSFLGTVVEWVGQHAPEDPRSIVDVGAGTGTGSLALARRFVRADVVAIDASPTMLERVEAAARDQGLSDRISVLLGDLDDGWPETGAFDIAWAALSIHHFADPDRVLRNIHTELNPGGLLVVVEMDGPPRILPDEIDGARLGLETRIREVMTDPGWNAHPDWRPQLEHAGFEIAEQRDFTFEVDATTPNAGRYADAYLRRISTRLSERLAADDLAVLDRLLTADGPDSLLSRDDLVVRGRRTAWAAHRR